MAQEQGIHLGVLGVRPPPSLLFNFAAYATKCWFKNWSMAATVCGACKYVRYL